MKTMANAKRRTYYRLGTICNGSLYLFTELGEFRSFAAAVTYWKSQPRNGQAVVVKDIDLGWGIKSTVYTTDGTEVRS